MKHAKPNSHQSQEHKLEQLIHLTIDSEGAPTSTHIPIHHSRIDRHNAPLRPSIPNPIASHSISPLEELKSLKLSERISVIGLATLRCQGRSIEQLLSLSDKEGDFITSSLIEHNAYLITRLSNWLADHLF